MQQSNHGAALAADTKLADAPLPLLSKREVADMLGVSEGTIDNRRKGPNGLRYVRIGSRVLFDPNDIRAYIDAQKIARIVPLPAAGNEESR
jgi:predicted DNA-binding transcriptional regulator AlpA